MNEPSPTPFGSSETARPARRPLLRRLAEPVLLGVVLGLALRTYHYVREPGLWHDEAALLLNVLDKTFDEMFGPLLFAEAAPPGFLWLERAVSLVLGDGLWALRLVPFLASCASLLLVAWLARGLLPPVGQGVAVFLFAVSDRLLWHGCEAKPYSTDILFGALVPVVFVASARRSLGTRILVFAGLTPLMLFVSFPGCFLCGGLLLAVLPDVWRARSDAGRLSYLGWVVLVAACFFGLVLGPAKAQRCDSMDSCWADVFPDTGRPARLPSWFVSQTFGVGYYAINPSGEWCVPLAVLGAIALARAGQGRLVRLMVIPIGLAAVAALLKQYPYGGFRVMSYAIPAVIILTGAGAAAVFTWATTGRRFLTFRRGVLAGFAVILLLPAANTARRLTSPWVRIGAKEATGYVLGRIRPGEQVLANSWEYAYFFRGRPEFRLGIPAPSTSPLPHWIIVSAGSAEVRNELLKPWLTAGTVTEDREFAFTRVVRVVCRGGA